MVAIKLDEWIKAMSDANTLKILFYLREFNPNVTAEDLHKNLSIPLEEINEKLKRLEELKIVLCLNSKYSLSTDGRRVVDSIYQGIGEEIPTNLTVMASVCPPKD